MSIKKLKTIFLLSFTLLAGIIIFMPGDAEASFINYQTWVRKRDADGGYSPAQNITFTLASTRDSSYKWVNSSGDCLGCDGEAASVTTTTLTTTSDGKTWYKSGNSANIACGNTVCPEGDAGTCNPFRLTGSIDGSGFDADISEWILSGTGDNASGSGFSVDASFGVLTNSVDPDWYVTFNRKKDRLSVSLTGTVDANNNKMDCIDNVPDPDDEDGVDVSLVATTSHDTNFSHTLTNYQWDFTNNGSIDQITSSGSITKRYKMSDLSSSQRNTLMTTGSVSITARVYRECNPEGKRAAEAVTSFTLLRSDRRLVCVSLNGAPKSGNVPLTVTFTGALKENWCTADESDYRFGFDFLGNGFDRNNLQEDDRITTATGADASGNITSVTAYTYILENVGGFNAKLHGWLNSQPDIVPASCPSPFTVNSQFFSDTNYQEVAP